ncbi:MAG: TolC family protein [Candidatus Aminicenantes bacterium]|nr:TolC family protein [Candidatus Aminicenantes bacterium]NTV80376.1 TolC family protein [Candidatus Aminicenantes bacterium]
MTKKPIFPLLILALALAGPAFGQQAQSTMSVSLDDCIVRALKDNLGVAIQVLGPQISAESVNAAQEKYIPSLTLSYSSRKTENAAYSYLDTPGDSTINKTRNYNFMSANQTLPTGGTLRLDFTGYRTTTNQRGRTIDPRFGTTLAFNLSQPLLKNFGPKISRREILVARNNLGVSEESLKNTLINTVYNVESAYWNLVYSIENLEVRKQSLALAKDLLEKNQRSVEVGTLAPMEVLSARAEVATREADLIQAETQIKSNEDALRLLLNISEAEGQSVSAVLPKDKPTYVPREVSFEEAITAALQNRPDLEISRIGLETEKINISYAKNQILPELNLSASYSAPGIDGTRLIYNLPNPLDPDAEIIDTIPGGIGGALKQSFGFTYPNWNLGLTLNLPLSNVFGKASLAQARLNMRQAMLEMENQKEQVYIEIKNAVRAVEANYKRIQAYTTARELAEQKLAAEEEKRRVGMSTNYVVLTYQRDLANARISELNSIISYNVSVASLEKAMGTNLKSKNINLSDYAPGLD